MNIKKIIAALIVSTAGSGTALAEPPTPPQQLPSVFDHSVIDGNALSGARGQIGVNMAAGSNNAQTNAAAIGLATDRGMGIGHVSLSQRIQNSEASGNSVANAQIGGSAFSNSSGLIGINQASGAGNAQANIISIGIGLNAKAAADAELAQTVTGVGASDSKNSNSNAPKMATIEGNAFNGSRGVVQVNQSAGVGNATGNSFAMRVETGAGGLQ